MGLIGRALVHLCCAGNPERLTGMRLRFTAPVVPGEINRTEDWRGAGAIRFRASVPARSVVVADGGVADLDNFAPENETAAIRSEEHSTGKECVVACRFLWVPK